MIKIDAEVKDINYDTLVELLMPYLVKWLSEKDNIFFDMFTKLISKKGKPNWFTRFLVSAVPKKTELTAWILPRFDELLMEYVNSMIDKLGVVARMRTFDAKTIERSHKTMLRIEFMIEEIDYEKTIDNLLPDVLQKLSANEEKPSKLSNLLLRLDDLPKQVLEAAIRAIPTDQRDNIASMFLNEYKEELAGTLNSIISQNHIKAEVSTINAVSK